MLHQAIALLITLMLSIGVLPAHGDEVDELRASFEREIAALNARDLETLMDNQHERLIALNPASPTPLQ